MLGNTQTAAAGLSEAASKPVAAAMLNTVFAMQSMPDAHQSIEV